MGPGNFFAIQVCDERIIKTNVKIEVPDSFGFRYLKSLANTQRRVFASHVGQDRPVVIIPIAEAGLAAVPERVVVVQFEPIALWARRTGFVAPFRVRGN